MEQDYWNDRRAGSPTVEIELVDPSATGPRVDPRGYCALHIPSPARLDWNPTPLDICSACTSVNSETTPHQRDHHQDNLLHVRSSGFTVARFWLPIVVHMKLGIQVRIKTGKSRDGSWGGSLESLLERNKSEITIFYQSLKLFSDSQRLDDYGVFRVGWHILNNIGIKDGRKKVSFAQALRSKEWDKASKLMSFIALMNSYGLRVLPLETNKREVLTLVDVGGEYDQFNSVRLELSGVGPSGAYRIRGVVWDGCNQIGKPATGLGLGNPIGSPMNYIKGRPCNFSRRKIPKLFSKGTFPGEIPFVGSSSTNISFKYSENLRTYLKLFPELNFGEMAFVGKQEIDELAVAASLKKIRSEIKDEKRFIDGLIRSIQSYTTYRAGPLRSPYEVLGSKMGDCDELSLLMASFLLASGYHRRQVFGLRWDGHLALAIKPFSDSPIQGAKIVIPGYGKYYCVDMAYYIRGFSGPKTAWGDLDAGYLGNADLIELKCD